MSTFETRSGLSSQSIAAKRVEVADGFYGDLILADPDQAELHRARAAKTIIDMSSLQSMGVSLSPFLEVGAGCVQRSAVLKNHFGAEGVATDLNHGSLANGHTIIKLLGYGSLPLLVCCDAQYLPFADNTFRFVFTMQTLHRFTDPRPVVAECYRVLGQRGYFFVDEEPVSSPIRQVLRGGRTLVHPRTPLQRFAQRLGIEKVFWDDAGPDRYKGLIVSRFSLARWRQILDCFDSSASIEVNRRLRLRLTMDPRSVSFRLARLVGGNIRAVCQKASGVPATDEFQVRFICVDCRAPIVLGDREQGVRCSACGRVFPYSRGVVRMLPRSLEDELYHLAEPPQ